MNTFRVGKIDRTTDELFSFGMSAAAEREEWARNADMERADDGGSSSSDDDEGEEFEFAFPLQGQHDDAVDLFADGRGHPVYPVFDRSILRSDGGGDGAVDLSSSFQELSVEGSAGSGSDAPDSAPAGSYCVWSPRTDHPPLDRKSRSTGTSSSPSRKWNLMDVMVGRSRSDGKEKFLFLAATNPTPRKERKKTIDRKVVTEMDMKTAHKLYYGKGGAGGRRQSSYLPYRKALVGFRPF